MQNEKECIVFLIDEKEERWVNDMADRGWNLKKTVVGYFVLKKGHQVNIFIEMNLSIESRRIILSF